MRNGETIVALSSGSGKAGVAVIRISGPKTRFILETILSRFPEPRTAVVRRIYHPVSRETLDRGLVLWFPKPHSFTGEDTAELHVHGSRSVVSETLRALGDLPDVRLARAGEFARRAFINGRIDLTEAEGLADLIDSETEQQRKQALRQIDGYFKLLIDSWREQTLNALALAEAHFDFADEDDVEAEILTQAVGLARVVADEITTRLDDARTGERIRDGLVIVIAGAPNAGKSTLLNRIAERDIAIVSDIPGTTRDVLELRLDLGGYAAILVDTAGIRASNDDIEKEGINRARRYIDNADLVLWLQDVTDVSASEDIVSGPVRWRIGTKADLVLPQSLESSVYDLVVSVKSGDGVNALLQALLRFANETFDDHSDAVITRERHREALSETVSHLQSFLRPDGRTEDLRVEDLRQAAHSLGRITGAVDVEDLLGRIFSRFCVGK